MTNTSRPWAVLVLAAALACGREDGALDEEIAGHYVGGDEVSSFVPCGMRADPDYGRGYWLAPSDDFGSRYRALVDQLSSGKVAAFPKVYVRFRGRVSEPGKHGHLGAYEREVAVGEVLEMSLEGKCS
jgi:hypothetical protein